MTDLAYKGIKAVIITVFDKFKKLGNGLNMLNTDQKKKLIKLLVVKTVIIFMMLLKLWRKTVNIGIDLGVKLFGGHMSNATCFSRVPTKWYNVQLVLILRKQSS